MNLLVAFSCVVIVLGYPTRDDGKPSQLQKNRVARAVEVFHNFKCDKLITTGGAVANPHFESETMAEIAIQKGIPAHRVSLEKQSRNTYGNIKFSQDLWQRAEHIYIVSEYFHARRGKRYLLQLDPTKEGKTEAVGYTPPAHHYWLSVYSFLYNGAAWVKDAFSPPK